jgi:RNA polymerase sigma-70 factor (ECF subfamily)
MSDSAELQAQLARIALGDRAALRRVYDLTSAHLLGVALRILNRRDEAEDVLQDAFVSVWHHAGSYSAAQAQPMTWLISIVRNKALDVIRSARMRHETELPQHEDGDEHDVPDDRSNPLQMLTEASETMRIRACMESLDASHRQSLALAYYHGMTHAEIAAHMGSPLGTVKAWVRRGLERMKRCLEHEEAAAGQARRGEGQHALTP